MARRRLVLSPALVDDLRRLVVRGRDAELETLGLSSIELAAAVELACATLDWRRNAAPVVRTIDRWSADNDLLAAARSALEGDVVPFVDDFAAPASEVRAAPSRAEFIADGRWPLFLQRFDRGLRQRCGFQSTLANGIVAAMNEMVDNIVQHSGMGSTPRGIVAYAVAPRTFTFAVADVGVGVLSSLRQNPTWTRLGTSLDALNAVVRDGATCRVGVARGGGFRILLRNLADLNASLRFRSGDAVLTLDGRFTGAAVLPAVERTCVPLAGLQVSVSCMLAGA